MEPARIKYYGLVSMTRRTYLIATSVVGLACAALLIWLCQLNYLPPLRWPWDPLPKHNREGLEGLYMDHFWTLVLVCLLAETIDIMATLRAFARKEAELRDSAANGNEGQQ